MTDYAVYQSHAVDESGNILAGASVEVRSETTGNLVTLYSGRTSGALANPFTADADGYFRFHTVGDFLKVRVYTGSSASPTSERIFRYVPVGLAGGYDIDQLMRLVPDGTVAAPGLAFANDNDTGLYRIGANNIGIAANGSKIVDISSTAVTITEPVSITDATEATSDTTGALKVTGGISTQGALYVSANSHLGTSGSTQITSGSGGTGATGANFNLDGGSGSGGGPNFNFKKNGTGIWSMGAVSSLSSGTSNDFGIVNIALGAFAAKIFAADSALQLIGTTESTSSTTGILQVKGGVGVVKNIYGAQAILSTGATHGIGYATGAGGTVTQATSKSTGVTLNKTTGKITMHNATLNAGAEVGFTVTNSAVASTDVVVVNIVSGATADSYHVEVDAVGLGSFRISLTNVSASNLGEAIVIRFAVIKSVDA